MSSSTIYNKITYENVGTPMILRPWLFKSHSWKKEKKKHDKSADICIAAQLYL